MSYLRKRHLITEVRNYDIAYVSRVAHILTLSLISVGLVGNKDIYIAIERAKVMRDLGDK